ncbi:LuxR C-terminal-related transcriptional regulator [Nocardia tengchongensis]
MRLVRAEGIRTSLRALASADLEPREFLAEAIPLLTAVVPAEFVCTATIDPQTTLITATVESCHSTALRDIDFARHEYGHPVDVNRFAELAARPVPVGILAEESAGDPARSLRYREFLRPHFGFEHELRCLFRTGGTVWGAVGMYRAAGTTGFDGDDAAFVASVSQILADGIRGGLVRGPAGARSDWSGPAVLIVDGDQVAGVTAEGSAALALLGGPPAATPLFGPVADAVAAVRFPNGRPAAARVRAVTGEWLTVRATPLLGAGAEAGAGPIAVTIEPTRVDELVPLLAAACDLTTRERTVVDQVLAGRSTAEIARSLHLSAYTVQDHLKSVFAKTGVNSRRALVARLSPAGCHGPCSV